MKQTLFSSKGSATVEASVIFSVVFLLIAALVYTFIIIYQCAFLQSIVNQAANDGSYYYVNSLGINSKSNLYWRIYDTNSQEKELYLEKNIKKELSRSIFYSDRTVYIDTSYRLLMQQLTVNVEEKIPLPVGNLFNIFGIPSSFKLNAEAVTPLDDNAEFIRNMDTVIDIKNCLLNSDNKWIGEGSQVNEIIKKLIKTN